MSELPATVNDLARACARSADAAEWQEFVSRCTPLASIVALRVSRMWGSDPSPVTVDDMVQEVFLKLCENQRRILREFEPRGENSFFGLLRIVTASVANDYFRRLHSVKRGGKIITMQLADEDTQSPPDTLRLAARIRQSTLLAQLDNKLRAAPEIVSERDRALFWLYYRQGYTAEEIARLAAIGLTAKGVESALRRITTWLREELNRTRAPIRAESG